MQTFRDFDIDVPDSFDGDRLTKCPACSDSRKKKNAKCLSVNGDGMWLCHHCGFKGSLKSGVERRAEPFRRPKVYSRPTYRPPEAAKSICGLPDKTIAWFAARGISEAVLARNKIGRGEVYMPQVEDTVIAIQFPYYRAGEVVNVKYRDADKNFRLATDAELILYGLDDISDKQLLIVEGEIDKLSVEAAGYASCVSVPNGAPALNTQNYERHFQYLESAADRLDQVAKILIAVDNDAPGQKLEAELVRRFGVARCYRTHWPAGCKDANDVLVQHGIAALKACIDKAEAFPVEGWVNLDRADYLMVCREGRKPGEHPGWSNLAEYYTVKPGDWTVITGIPNSGKSTWLDAMLINLAQAQGWGFAIFSPEMGPTADHAALLTEQFMGANTRSLSDEKLGDCYDWITDHFHWIEPDDHPTLDNVLKIAKLMVMRKGIRGLIIDPWNELEHNRGTLSETDHISASLSKVRAFARQHQIHIWIVAHPTKLQTIKKDDSREVYPVPTPYDISGSSNWRNKADCCLTLWRDFSNPNDRKVSVHIQKVRRKEVGKLGCVELYYERETGRYYEGEQTSDSWVAPDAEGRWTI